MTEKRACPSCDRPLPDDAPEGLCPQCLLREGLAAGDADDAEIERELRAALEMHLPELEILELLGRGGMGYVYRARQTKLDREVAVKVLSPDLAERQDFAERFEREAQALAKLNHPNIVTVHDFGQEEQLFYLILELVDGTDLRALIRGGELSPEEALAIVPVVCDALQYAHDRGIVHRDVKPENILVDREGRVKIADFGLAKLVGTSAALVTLTGSQQVMGTLRYMAPEQLDRPLEVDHRADIYSLGVVFYEMLTGEIPMGRFDPPSEKSRVDARLDDVVLRALEKEPERRYQHASEVRSDVESAKEPAPDRARPKSTKAPEERRISAQAVGGLVLSAGAAPLASLFTVFWVVRLASENENSLAAVSTIILLITTLPCLGALATGWWLGKRGLDAIREGWPNLYGIGSALTAMWIAPLVLIDLIVIALINVPVDIAGTIPALLIPLEIILLLTLNVAFIVWQRKRELASLETIR